MKTFAERLRHAQAAGKMTTADLALWFRRPYPTVRAWLTHGYDPWGPNGKEAHRVLELLEIALNHDDFLPVPIQYTPRMRRDHVKKARDAYDRRISKVRAAG